MNLEKLIVKSNMKNDNLKKQVECVQYHKKTENSTW